MFRSWFDRINKFNKPLYNIREIFTLNPYIRFVLDKSEHFKVQVFKKSEHNVEHKNSKKIHQSNDVALVS